MGREKSQRNISYKPMFKHFLPKDLSKKGKTLLLAEEIEALYLMDILELYQEEAAKKMEISRSTFARILKNARKKLTLALVGGHEILLQDLSEDTFVAICVNFDGDFSNIALTNRHIEIYKITQGDVEKIKTIKNPLYKSELKPAKVLPEIFVKERVNVFVSSYIGEGLKNSLLFKGIDTMVKKRFCLEDMACIFK